MDDVARVREKIDIVSLISEYIPLKKMGRNFKALCPFHTESTPSFVVSPERQIWHCFGGCAKGGDCFEFLMEYEHLEFGEALRTLAKKAGVELRDSAFAKGLSSKKEKIYKLNRLANEFFHFVLTKHVVGKKALSYLSSDRKIDDRLIETFMIGFSPKSSNALVNYLINKKGYKKEDLIDAGLAFQRNRDIVDFFRGRIMFPLFDHRGNIVGFSGRLLSEVAGLGGKYINTKETLAYHKGSMFFGLNTAIPEIKNKDNCIVVEGELDVVSMFKEGIKNAVAIKGTALTDDQASLLSRFTQNVTLCFDQDNAGWMATERSLGVLEKKGFNVKVIKITNAKDPDEAVRSDPFSFKKDIKESIGIYDYFLQRSLTLYNKNTIEGKKNISDFLLPVIERIENEIVKEHYLKKLSLELDTTYDSLLKQVEKIEKKEAGEDGKKTIKADKSSRREILEEYLLAIVAQYENPSQITDKVSSIIKDYVFETPSYKKILDSLSLYAQKNDDFSSKKFLNDLPSELIKTFDTCFLLPIPKFEDLGKHRVEIEKVARELRVIFLKNKIKEITENLRGKEKEENSKEIESLGKEASMLINLLSQS
ncbi:MAG: hypothetical protein ACD_50C00372G0002 [uncultured bacterium]|nr:MAG: hypothetical protein ACD_50C00372G0002 [uncultured bacterium]OGH14458.1 MAG: DNA primase [Candidatus Levybacteria bacterium RIFCSPHIGHO2_01_FULL_38_26]